MFAHRCIVAYSRDLVFTRSISRSSRSFSTICRTIVKNEKEEDIHIQEDGGKDEEEQVAESISTLQDRIWANRPDCYDEL